MDTLCPSNPSREALLKGPIENKEIDPFQLAFEESPVPTALASISYIKGAGTGMVMVNKAFADLFKCDPEEIEEVNALAAVLRKGAHEEKDGLLHFDPSNGGDHTESEIRVLRRKGGGTFIGEISRSIVRANGDGALLLFATVQDVTERELAERRRVENEQRLIDLINRVPVGVMITNWKDGKIVHVNPALLEILGYNPAEIENHETRKLYKDKEVRETFRRLIAEKGTVENFPVEFTRGNGTVVPCSITAVIQRDPTGEIKGYAGIVKDMTEEKKARELELALAKEKAGLEARSKFRGEMIHDIRNPLSAAQAYSYVIERCIESGDLDRAHQSVLGQRGQIHEVNNRLGLLGDDAFLESEGLEFSFEEIGVNSVVELLENITEPFGVVAKEKGLAFSFIDKVPEDITSTVRIDTQKLKRVLGNLVDNASKYTSEGSVSLTVTADLDYLVIKCSDTGCGIPADEIPKIFDRGIRASNKSDVPGTGLGLAIVKKIVEAHGGKIEVQSELEKGSVFIVKLPFIKKEDLQTLAA